MKTFAVLLALVAVAGMGCGDRNTVAPDPPTTPETSDALRPVGVAFTGYVTTHLDMSTARIWVDETNTEHVRGATAHYITYGKAAGVTFTGDGIGYVDWDIQLDSGDGVVSAEESHSCTWGKKSGAFVGKTQCDVKGGRVVGSCVRFGEGGFEGWQFRGSFDDTRWGVNIQKMSAVISRSNTEWLP